MVKPFAETGRADVLKTLNIIERHKNEKQPLSLIRLGNDDGNLLGYPDFITRAELNKSLVIWFGTTEFENKNLIDLSKQLRIAVEKADIVGIPRIKQQERIEYQSVIQAIRGFNLVHDRHMLTDSAIHRYLQFGLFYRKLLSNITFCGLITCRNLLHVIQNTFKIEKVEQYLVPGEAQFPGEYKGAHFPICFYELKKKIRIPFKGAIFLVGAGALGKIYCHWIKEAGGIAIDIGSIFDAWAQVKSRLKKPCHNIEQYNLNPSISLKEAIIRHNELCDLFELDTVRLSLKDYPLANEIFF